MDEELLNENEEEITPTPSEDEISEESGANNSEETQTEGSEETPIDDSENISEGSEESDEIEIPTQDEPGYGYNYPIYDQTNNLIENPDLEAGYLKKEYFTVHHNSIPETWHYDVVSFSFADGGKYVPTSNEDEHVEVIDDQKGIFGYVSLEGEDDRVVTGQTIRPTIDTPLVQAWDETKTIYRYVEYTAQELAEKDFLTNGPALLAEAQETIEDLLLVLADLLGGAEEEE